MPTTNSDSRISPRRIVSGQPKGTASPAQTRRRGAALEAAIFAAVRDQLGELGYSGVTYEGVASAAGTGKGALYRRWPTKAEMVVAATVAAGEAALAETRDTGALRTDLIALMLAIRDLFATHRRATVLSLMAQLDVQATESLHAFLFARNTERLMKVIERARLRGELGGSALTPRVLGLPFDVARHDAFIVGTMTDPDVASFVDDCYLPLLIAVGGSAPAPG